MKHWVKRKGKDQLQILAFFICLKTNSNSVFKSSVIVGRNIKGEKSKQLTPLYPLKKEITMTGNRVLISKLISLYLKSVTSFKCLKNGIVSIAFHSLNLIVSVAILDYAVHSCFLYRLLVIYKKYLFSSVDSCIQTVLFGMLVLQAN